MFARFALSLGMLMLFGVAVGCDDDPEPYDRESRTQRNPELTGDACVVPEDCYPDVEPGALRGDAVCMDRVEGGYCTHLCVTDADCCAAPAECATELPQVCSPFESTGLMMCFLACESENIGSMEENEYCQHHYGPDFHCRSSGGGNQNRKVCVPGGPACGDPGDCPGDLANCCYDSGGAARYCYGDIAADGRDCL